MVATSLMVVGLLGASAVPAAAHTQACTHSPSEWSGKHDFPATQSGYRWGVKATIDVDGDSFDPCTGSDGGGVSAWVSLEPYDYLPSAILQIGIIDCHAVTDPSNPDDPCYYHPNSPRFFWAMGGCPTSKPAPPYALDLGAADYNAHTYEITSLSNTTLPKYYHLTIDGGTNGDIWVTSGFPEINCWVSAVDGSSRHMIAGVFAERWDSGDSNGHPVGGIYDHTKFRTVRIQNGSASGGSWISPGWTTGSTNVGCERTPYIEQCDVVAGDGLDAWTTN
jgi:hypothetical protein